MKTLLLVLLLLFQTSCGRLNDVEDYAVFVASGGIFPLPENYNSLCDIGLAKCDEKNTTVQLKSDDIEPNQAPIVEFFIKKIEMKVGDIKNVELKILDFNDDNISKAYYFIEDPTMAELKITDEPWELNIAAKKGGKTNIRVLVKDDFGNEGNSILLPLTIVDLANINNTQIKFTEQAIEMFTSSTYSIQYIYAGLKSDYQVSYRSENNLVSIVVKKNNATIVVNSKNQVGTDKLTFTFIDGDKRPFDVVLRVLVKKKPDITGGPTNSISNPNNTGGNTNTGNQPKAPRETDTMVFNDPDACLDSSPWSSIDHKYGESKNKAVSRKNSISIQSLTNNSTVKLYYREVLGSLDTPFGLDINAPQIGLPIKNNTRDVERLFIIQGNPIFLGSGYFYLKIKGDCYRGLFPKDTSAKESEKAKYNIKLVINDN
jgi:hypothetical protein